MIQLRGRVLFALGFTGGVVFTLGLVNFIVQWMGRAILP